jgi:hypothetical protein
LNDTAEVALEDYARAITRAQGAEAVPEALHPARVGGVHVCGLESAPGPAILADLEHFARDLALRHEGNGLGWA